VHIAQFPLGMGKGDRKGASNTLALTLDADGKVQYDAIVKHGHAADKVFQLEICGFSEINIFMYVPRLFIRN